MSKTMTERETLKQIYLTVVREWALEARDIAESLEMETKAVRSRLTKLRRARLVEGTQVNGVGSLVWQSYYNTQDYDLDEEMAKAEADFNEAFPEEVKMAGRSGGATGSRYTEAQLEKGLKAKAKGLSRVEVAKAAGVKSPNYFHGVLVAVEKARGR